MRELTIEEKLIFFPERVLSPWNPTTTIGWATRGILHFLFTMAWALTVIWWAGPLITISKDIYSSYRKHRDKNKL